MSEFQPVDKYSSSAVVNMRKPCVAPTCAKYLCCALKLRSYQESCAVLDYYVRVLVNEVLDDLLLLNWCGE